MTPQQLAEATAARMLAEDGVNASLNIRLDSVAPGIANLSMRVENEMLNGHQSCHGGLLFTLADAAFAIACNTQNIVTVASGAKIEFLAPAYLGDQLTARAKEVTQSGRSGIYDVEIYNQKDTLIALFRGNSRRIKGQVITN